jgi:hypothetical protein
MKTKSNGHLTWRPRIMGNLWSLRVKGTLIDD